MKGYFTLRINKAGLDLIVKHLNKGIYEDVAVLLSELRAQVEAQLEQPKKKEETQKNPTGPSRYARSP